MLPLVCALIGPAWDLWDPFVTLPDLGAAALRRIGGRSWSAAEYPERFGVWPAVGAFVGYAWSRTLALEFRPRFMAAQISHATLDGGGLVSFAPDRITFTLHVPLVVRFDDIVSY